ncbi:AN1-type zinc finger protein 5-like [Grus japonensis]|uniref:AN1-type zinc finger protein 5-like n=1 Tax=Grus japonensis TaxID=30415 RepID=A0ABC9WCV9_GRUJA
MEKTMVRQAVLLQSMEGLNGGADIHLQPLEDPAPEQLEAPERSCDSMGSPRWSRFAGRTCDPMEGTHAGAAREELQPMGRTHIGEVHGRLSPMGRTQHWSRGRV